MAEIEVAKTVSRDVVPAEVHGFSVKVGIGPYPPDQERSHRKAVYAELRPKSRLAFTAMRAKNRERILGMAPLMPAAAREIEADPEGELAEITALDALRQASALARELVT